MSWLSITSFLYTFMLHLEYNQHFVVQTLVGIGALHLFQLASGGISGLYHFVQLLESHGTNSMLLFENDLGLVTDVVPQTYQYDKENFVISTLICAWLTTGGLRSTIFDIVFVLVEWITR